EAAVGSARDAGRIDRQMIEHASYRAVWSDRDQPMSPAFGDQYVVARSRRAKRIMQSGRPHLDRTGLGIDSEQSAAASPIQGIARPVPIGLVRRAVGRKQAAVRACRERIDRTQIAPNPLAFVPALDCSKYPDFRAAQRDGEPAARQT